MLQISQTGTTKQKPRLNRDGYSYVKDRTNNEKTYWQRIKYSSDRCHSRLYTCTANNTIVKQPTEHTCKFDATVHQLRSFSQQVADRVINTQATPDTIITNCYKDILIVFSVAKMEDF